MKYRKKPIVIEAVQYDGTLQSVSSLGMAAICQNLCSDEIEISTLEGVMKARPGDYIIKGIRGEFYPCKADIFEASYEAIHNE